MNYFEESFIKIVLFIVLIGFGLLLAFPVMWCWNYVVPEMFGLPELTWGKAWCLHFLANIFIRSMHIHPQK